MDLTATLPPFSEPIGALALLFALLIGHALAKRRARAPFSVFFACSEQDSELFLSVDNTTGEVLPYNDRRIRNSPDGEYHWCSKYGKDDTDTICLFVPQHAF